MIHISVMKTEAVRYLLHRDSQLVIDATVGAGGHAVAILAARENVHVIGVDRDPQILVEANKTMANFEGRFRLVNGNYAEIGDVLERNQKADGVLVDLGVSSLQIDLSTRGFSYSVEGPLDMRMSDSGSTAKVLLEKTDEAELTSILQKYGEVTGARRISRAIRAAVDRDEMNSTFDLRSAVESALRGTAQPSLLSKVFQAIRIVVNDELGNLERFLESLVGVLRTNARVVVIAYHSLEDRIVKDFFVRESHDCICPPHIPVCVCEHRAVFEVLTRKVVKPTKEETERNPRARSARLRAARFIGQEGA